MYSQMFTFSEDIATWIEMKTWTETFTRVYNTYSMKGTIKTTCPVKTIIITCKNIKLIPVK